ncbi:MAG: hypothetical protein LAO04_22630 [Acidobacteriia bacterium]|nr:hypothetical protein [Terriglobia bacterium]
MGWKSVWKCENRNEVPPVPKKSGGGLEKGLANLWRGMRFTGEAHTGREQESKWEISKKVAIELPTNNEEK